MMKRLVVLATLGLSASAGAADFGVGMSFRDNDSVVYVPIEFGESLRIEPLVRYVRSEVNVQGATAKSDTLQVGVGVFGLKQIGESIRAYYGGRASYLDSDTAFAPDGVSDRDASGYRVAPVFGFEYSFNEHLSLGGEAEWFYQDVDADALDMKSTGTNTRIIIRFMF